MKRPGFTLIEMLCVMLLIVVMGTAFARLLRQTLEIEQLQGAGFDKAVHVHALADQFRADVAGATRAPERWQNYEANAQTLVLQTPGGHIVYAVNESGLERQWSERGKTTIQTIPSVESNFAVEFVRAAENPQLIEMRLRFLGKGHAIAEPTLEIAAALGGDER